MADNILYILDDSKIVLEKNVKLYKHGFRILPYTTNVPSSIIIDHVLSSNLFATKLLLKEVSGITISSDLSAVLFLSLVANKLLLLLTKINNTYITTNNVNILSTQLNTNINNVSKDLSLLSTNIHNTYALKTDLDAINTNISTLENDLGTNYITYQLLTNITGEILENVSIDESIIDNKLDDLSDIISGTYATKLELKIISGISVSAIISLLYINEKLLYFIDNIENTYATKNDISDIQISITDLSTLFSTIYQTKKDTLTLSTYIKLTYALKADLSETNNNISSLETQLTNNYISKTVLPELSANISNLLSNTFDNKYVNKDEFDIKFNTDILTGQIVNISNKIDAYSIDYLVADYYKLKFTKDNIIDTCQISLLVTNIPLGKFLCVRIDNSNANKIVFGTTVILTLTDTGIYNIIFGNTTGKIVLFGNKILETE